MKPFTRERFLFWMLAGVMGINALFFAYGLFACSRSEEPHLICPNIGTRFDNYSEKALAAVLGLIAGAGAISFTQRSQTSSDDRDVSASQPPLQLQQPSPKSSLASDLPQSEREASSSRQESAPSSRKRNPQS